MRLHVSAYTLSPVRPTQEAITALFQATRTSGSNDPAVTARCQALRSAVAAGLVAWLAELPEDDSELVHDLALCLMAELEHLTAKDRVQVLWAAVRVLEDLKPHCCTLLELVPACVVLIGSNVPSMPGSQLGEGSQPSLSTPTGGSRPTAHAACSGRMHEGCCFWMPAKKSGSGTLAQPPPSATPLPMHATPLQPC